LLKIVWFLVRPSQPPRIPAMAFTNVQKFS
jgi:hypothetical protein